MLGVLCIGRPPTPPRPPKLPLPPPLAMRRLSVKLLDSQLPARQLTERSKLAIVAEKADLSF